MKREIHLTIANRLAYLSWFYDQLIESQPQINPLWLMRSWGREKTREAGLRASEAAALRIASITARKRSGVVRILEGKGLNTREVPLNTTAQHALHLYLDSRSSAEAEEPLFLSGRGGAMPTRTVQAVIAHLARRAKIDRVRLCLYAASYVCVNYLRQSPGKLVELFSSACRVIQKELGLCAGPAPSW